MCATLNVPLEVLNQETTPLILSTRTSSITMLLIPDVNKPHNKIAVPERGGQKWLQKGEYLYPK